MKKLSESVTACFQKCLFEQRKIYVFGEIDKRFDDVFRAIICNGYAVQFLPYRVKAILLAIVMGSVLSLHQSLQQPCLNFILTAIKYDLFHIYRDNFTNFIFIDNFLWV